MPGTYLTRKRVLIKLLLATFQLVLTVTHVTNIYDEGPLSYLVEPPVI